MLKKILVISVLLFCFVSCENPVPARMGFLIEDPNGGGSEYILDIDFQNTSVEIGDNSDATVDISIIKPGLTITHDSTDDTAITITAIADQSADIININDFAGRPLITVDESGDLGIGTTDPNVPLQVNGVIRSSTAEWWHCKYIHGFSVDPGASGATFTAPDGDTLGGYNLDADGEYLYFQAKICSDWDETSDIEIIIYYEVDDADATGDAVVDAAVYIKGDGESSTKSQSLSFTRDVSGDSQYTQHNDTLTLDYDNGSNPVDAEDLIMVKMNFDASNSDISDIIFTHAIIRYKTKMVNIEI